MKQQIEFTVIASKNQSSQRLDQTISKLFPNISRSQIKEWILKRFILVNGAIENKPKAKILGGEIITIIDSKIKKENFLKPQDIPLNIFYEDDDLIIINKQQNIVTHPGAGNKENTILNAVLHYYPPIINVPRAGIIHRLDKNTTGLMIIAKTSLAYFRLKKSLYSHQITREYEAIVFGHIISGGTIKQPICRNPKNRTCMLVNPMGKPAVTHYRVIKHFQIHTHLRLRLETGRTHQIRVHMAYINHPLVGDKMYIKRARLSKKASKEYISTLRKFNRQALHATMLRFHHPISNIQMEWTSPIPQDMIDLINVINKETSASNKVE